MTSPYVSKLAASSPFISSTPQAGTSSAPSPAQFLARASVSSTSTMDLPPLIAADTPTTITPVLPAGTRLLVHLIALPEAAASLPGWTIRWKRYGLAPTPTEPQSVSLALPKLKATDPTPLKTAPASPAPFKNIKEWIDSKPSLEQDPFELALRFIEESTEDSKDSPLPDRLGYISLQEREDRLERALWVFELGPSRSTSIMPNLARMSRFFTLL
jgi:hypothetical protein